ncbi:aldehyde dehydrogenase (NAD(P)(+)) ald5, partial [Tulasnella sp. 408]
LISYGSWLASERDVDIAVGSSRKAFETVWGVHAKPTWRGQLLSRLADLMERDAQLLAELESMDNGKPVSAARDSDIAESIACLRYYAGWTDKIAGQTIPTDDLNKHVYTLHEPIGVCAQIFPPGVLNCLPSTGPIGGAALSRHKDVDKIAFTGSTATGRKILEAAAQSNLKKVTLELGGKSPHLVFASADLDKAAEKAVLGIMYNMGQDCCGGSRIYAEASIYDKFVEKVAARAKEFSAAVGDPFADDTQGGPLVSEGQRDKVWGYIQSGINEGAKAIVGGKGWDGKGYYILPTVFTDIKPDMKIVKEEIFGPVVAIGKFETEQEAIELANATTYGLAAGIQSSPLFRFLFRPTLTNLNRLDDHRQIHRVTSALKAGTVWVNQYGTLHNNVPFGGYKQAGLRSVGGKAPAADASPTHRAV